MWWEGAGGEGAECGVRCWVFGLSSEGAAVVSLAPSSGRVENGLRGQGQREPGGGCLVGAAGPSRQGPWKKTRVAESIHFEGKDNRSSRWARCGV